MNDLTIYIPTYQRSHLDIKTLQFIGKELEAQTFLVVRKEERNAYAAKWRNIIATPPSVKGIAATRAYILKNSRTRYAVMLDDDLYFYIRDKKNLRLTRMTQKEFASMMKFIRKDLDKYVHVGISHRAMNNTKPERYLLNKRMMNAYAYDTQRLKELRIQFNRVQVMEDFDLTLQLLAKGCACKVYYDYAWNQMGSNADGGCSEYRTNEVQAAAAHKLKELHPNFVTIVERDSQWGNDFGTRTDVRVAWVQAAKAGGCEV